MNILLDKLDFNEKWAYETFKEIIAPEHKICVIPLAFHEDWITNSDDWYKAYNCTDGEFYKKIVSVFYDFGISDKNIMFINYFDDNENDLIKKISDSDIILFTGGFPEKIKKRLDELKITSSIENYKGIIMGWSAGAMVQCRDYFISPDEDYPLFQYEIGLDYISDFAVEVHFKGKDSQIQSIERYKNERNKKVFVTRENSAIIFDKGRVQLLGNVYEY